LKVDRREEAINIEDFMKERGTGGELLKKKEGSTAVLPVP